MAAVNPKRTSRVVKEMREGGMSFWADYLEAMGERIVDVVTSRDEKEKRIVTLSTAAPKSVRDAALVEASEAIWVEIEKLPKDDPEYAEGLQLASHIVNALRTTAPQPQSRDFGPGDFASAEEYIVWCKRDSDAPQVGARMFPMTDGPDLPWSLAEEIYGSDAFDYFEQSRYRGSNGLGEMAESGGWSWRALADCFDTYSAQCDYEAESDTRLEQRAEAFHAGQEGERP